jgi:hypothetical protein
MQVHPLVILTLIGLLPATAVSLSMFLGHNLFLAMFVMHWAAIAFTVIAYTAVTGGLSGLRWYIRYLVAQQLKSVLWFCIIFFFAGILVVVSGYISASCRLNEWRYCVGDVDDNIAKYGFQDAQTWLLIVSLIYFPLMNPLLEELFWRVFMMRAAGFFPDESSQRESDEEIGLIRGENGTSRLLSETLKTVPFSVRLLLSALYASYHTVVVGVFLGGIVYGVASFFMVTALGLIFFVLFSTFAFDEGFYPAVFLHMGVDIGVLVALGDAVGWYTLF